MLRRPTNMVWRALGAVVIAVPLVSCSNTDEAIDSTTTSATEPSDSGASAPPSTQSRASAPDSRDFATQLTSHFSGDASTPRSLDDVLAGVDAAVLGRMVSVDHGRRELLDNDDPTIVAANVNVEVQPDEVLFGELPAGGEPLYVEFPWPNNLDIDGLQASMPTDDRVIVLAQFSSDEAAALSASAVAAGASKPVPKNLVVVAPWGLIIESDAERADVPAAESNRIAPLARSIGIDVESFDDMADLLRNLT